MSSAIKTQITANNFYSTNIFCNPNCFAIELDVFLYLHSNGLQHPKKRVKFRMNVSWLDLPRCPVVRGGRERVKGVGLTGRELSRTDGTVVGDDMFCYGGVNALLSIMM